MGETPFQLAVAAAILAMLAIGGAYHRGLRPAQHSVSDRVVEGMRWLLFGPAILGLLLYLFDPGWMRWSQLPLHPALRWAGVVLLGLCVAGVWWAFHTLGRNFAATLLIREEHRLVAEGPYRHVRHPMYTLGLLFFVALFLTTASGFIGGLGVVGMAMVMAVRVPKEEAMLREHFKGEWDRYAARTGRFLPRLPRH